MNILNKLKGNYGATRNSKNLGRGIGSGKGKTSGRGGKGQTARSGVAIGAMEGGQMPLYIRLPKRGFNNYTRVEYEVINLNKIEHLINAGKLPWNITLEKLQSLGLYHGKKPLKILGNSILIPITIEAHKISNTAHNTIQSVGGVFIQKK
jgi:large subunit ribosomal protein L15